MTRNDKLQIYDLLKKASDSIYGFSSPSFPKETPNLIDDMEAAPSKGSSFSNEIMNDIRSGSEETSNGERLMRIAKKISECRRCRLCEGRTNTVSGMGVENPLVLVVGEGPGEQEDLQGLPFVGPAGILLDKMLAAISLSRTTNCYIANIVKCRPPRNRTPLPEEADACISFLHAQIAVLKPKAILAAGSTAVKNLLRTTNGVIKLHGQILDYKGIPLMTTYHPSALLHNPANKRTAWEDLKIFRAMLRQIDSDYAALSESQIQK
ncbi:MAG: uracil-DNA glycosylase [Treponema sp.]|nr:uracil-DNA glycosylase [Treponema sp.]